MSSISIFGLGYVGSVSAACFARLGHDVTGVDISAAKIEMLNSGRSPIVEAGMNDYVADAHRSGRLRGTTDFYAAVRDSEISFVCVGTPCLRNGKLDLSHIQRVTCEIGRALRTKKTKHTVVLRSTVLPGTTDSHFIPALESASGLRAGEDLAVCYNPEFLREGSAVADFQAPPYTILGANDPETFPVLRELYAGIPAPSHETTIAVAEMVKYVSNTFHALKVTFANEIGTLCKHLNLDTETVHRIFSLDTKLNISAAYLSPGFAFGGSCLPKDLRALSYRAKELDLKLPMLESIVPSNHEHLERALEIILRTGKTRIAMLGLGFKAATDDLRGSPQVDLVKRLLGEGCKVAIWDGNVSLGRLVGSNRQYIDDVIPHIGSLLSPSLEEAVSAAELVVVGTQEVQPELLRQTLRPEQIVIDLVNLKRHRRLVADSYEGICW